MSVHVQHAFAKWTEVIPEGEIRRLLKYQVKYYFGGGLPGALATEHLAGIVESVGRDLLAELAAGESGKALQAFNYSKTAGLDSLRLLLLQLLVKRQKLPYIPERDYHQMMITAGAQQSIYALLDATLNPGDFVLSAGPSYLGFVSPVVKLGGKVVLCPSDQQGLTVEGVETAINVIKRRFGVAPKLLYVIPDSDNPKGTTLPWERRQAFFEIAEREDILIVEDAAYKEIQFGGERIAPIKTLDVENLRVAYLASTSKEAGVLRLGYAMLPEDLRAEMEKARGFYDLCSPVLTQMIAERYYHLDLDSILKDVLDIYARRSNAMVESVEKYFPAGEMT
ncbi:MAG TPA: PLP-dependent aminotransferase family protein, partial [Calditrichia bacterium]|nr:PLP-dependent aminotransferase family protein [Calditrichia bacterium]